MNLNYVQIIVILTIKCAWSVKLISSLITRTTSGVIKAMDAAVLPGMGVRLLMPKVVQLLNAKLWGVPIRSAAFHVYDVTNTMVDASC